ncbi:DUF1488 domain-containing protein [Nissabacter sp. SGAir0207]|uniref:DUF1488 domain-containing protein n=1 Tax=Nissabacter sp. SGAir0207 TaxID=2126321 RepID=UPI0010CCBEB5|nr:DUF1488 domain-containing protein [Nissabacter sp. SGAir0207]QCR34863.1 DUF1488 domain-containing protein [Nissabacter sp. SGAir0207]
MNQAIHFPDDERWDDVKQCVVFRALVGGVLLHCALPFESMRQRFGANTPEQCLALFRQHRWDLEEEAEVLIAQDREGEGGWFTLS